jgi:tetratricopeptide (TPR) repeat protein
MTRLGRLSALTTASLFALSLGVGAVLAAGEPDPPGARNPGASQTQKPASGSKESTGSKKKQKKSEQEFRDGYRLAYALVQAGQFETAFAAFKDLDSDDTPDVANYLGYTARKLGDYELAKYWYERALANDPKHVRTWQYYGMWQVEQGNMLKAADFLQKIEAICGNKLCKEYQDLKGGMEGTVSY